jgi:hypothetical protein
MTPHWHNLKLAEKGSDFSTLHFEDTESNFRCRRKLPQDNLWSIITSPEIKEFGNMDTHAISNDCTGTP